MPPTFSKSAIATRTVHLFMIPPESITFFFVDRRKLTLHIFMELIKNEKFHNTYSTDCTLCHSAPSRFLIYF